MYRQSIFGPIWAELQPFKVSTVDSTATVHRAPCAGGVTNVEPSVSRRCQKTGQKKNQNHDKRANFGSAYRTANHEYITKMADGDEAIQNILKNFHVHFHIFFGQKRKKLITLDWVELQRTLSTL